MTRTGIRDEDIALRPNDFAGYIGQAAVKEVLEVSMEAAQERGEPLEHILIWGPPGYGKTTLANIIAAEMQSKITILIGGNLRSSGDVTNVMRRMDRGDTIFIDEIHRMWITAQEMLYPAMEDGILNQKLAGTQITTELPAFTLVGATTEVEKLAQPFIDRFGIKLKLEPYTPEELRQIIHNAAARLEVEIEEEAEMVVVGRCHGTPRIAVAMMRRLRDFAQYHEVKVMDSVFVNAILDKEGLQWTVE